MLFDKKGRHNGNYPQHCLTLNPSHVEGSIRADQSERASETLGENRNLLLCQGAPTGAECVTPVEFGPTLGLRTAPKSLSGLLQQSCHYRRSCRAFIGLGSRSITIFSRKLSAEVVNARKPINDNFMHRLET